MYTEKKKQNFKLLFLFPLFPKESMSLLTLVFPAELGRL